MATNRIRCFPRNSRFTCCADLMADPLPPPPAAPQTAPRSEATDDTHTERHFPERTRGLVPPAPPSAKSRPRPGSPLIAAVTARVPQPQCPLAPGRLLGLPGRPLACVRRGSGSKFRVTAAAESTAALGRRTASTRSRPCPRSMAERVWRLRSLSPASARGVLSVRVEMPRASSELPSPGDPSLASVHNATAVAPVL